MMNQPIYLYLLIKFALRCQIWYLLVVWECVQSILLYTFNSTMNEIFSPLRDINYKNNKSQFKSWSLKAALTVKPEKEKQSIFQEFFFYSGKVIYFICMQEETSISVLILIIYLHPTFILFIKLSFFLDYKKICLIYRLQENVP